MLLYAIAILTNMRVIKLQDLMINIIYINNI